LAAVLVIKTKERNREIQEEAERGEGGRMVGGEMVFK